MKHIKILDVNNYCRLKVICEYNRHLSIYYYFKFLLLDDNEKQIFLNADFNIINSIKFLIKESTLTEFMQCVFKISEDTYLDNFFDYKDNYRNYMPLNISKLENVKNTFYINDGFINKFITFVENYFNIKFLYHLIYIISNENNYQSEENVSIAEDFIFRFYNSDKFFLIMYYYFYQKISLTHEMLRHSYELEDVLDEGLRLPDFTNRRELHVKKIKKLLSELFSVNIYGIKRKMNELMTIFIKHKSNKSLLDHLNHIEIHSIILSERYNEYYNSNLYKSLVNIHNVKDKLIFHMSVNKITNTSNKFHELFIYLEDILDKHYFY
jgi:hypothetical protein